LKNVVGRSANASEVQSHEVVRTAVGGHETTYSVEELIKLRRQYAAAVNAEEQAERLARGESSGRFIQTRFVG
jgi:hypothetical protein